jgi:hypothetical protein
MINAIGNYVGMSNLSSSEEGSSQKPSFLSGDGSDVVLWIATDRLATMFKEGGGSAGVPLSPVTANGDTVGLIYDLSPNGMVIRNSSDITQVPTIQSDVTRNSFLRFVTNDRIVVQQVNFFNPIHGASPVFSLMFWIKFNGGNAATQHIMTNSNAASGAGFQITRNSNNKLFFRTSSAVPATISSYTSTTSLVDTTGWIPIIIICNGTGASAGRAIIGNVEDVNFTVNAGVSDNANGALFIGSSSGLTNFLNADLGELVIVNRVVTEDEIAAFKSYNPIRSSDEFIPILSVGYDMNDTSYLFTDIGGTIPATDGTSIRLIRNKKASNFGDLRRDASSAASGSSAIWRSNVENGKGALEFDGVDDNYTFQVRLGEDLAGKSTYIIIAKNDDNTNGSHIISGNNAANVGDYIALTGAGYASAGPGLVNPYWAIHTEPVGAEALASNAENPGVNNTKLLIFRRNGTEASVWNANKVKTTGVLNNPLNFSVMGNSDFGTATWNMDGYIFYVYKYNGIYNDAQIESMIDDLVVQYGIST